MKKMFLSLIAVPMITLLAVFALASCGYGDTSDAPDAPDLVGGGPVVPLE